MPLAPVLTQRGRRSVPVTRRWRMSPLPRCLQPVRRRRRTGRGFRESSTHQMGSAAARWLRSTSPPARRGRTGTASPSSA